MDIDNKIILIKLVAFIVILSIFSYLILFHLGVPQYEITEQCDIITDKWIRTDSGLFTILYKYVLELNDEEALVVDDFDYNNYNIGDTYCHEVTTIYYIRFIDLLIK